MPAGSFRSAWLISLLSVLCSCQATVSGTWTGRMESPNSIGVRFTIEERNGQLSGRTYWEDPVSHQLEPEGEFTGKRENQEASWVTEGAVVVTGKFDGDRFVGTITFPPDGDEPGHTVPVSLSR